jgi:hypothetical protein
MKIEKRDLRMWPLTYLWRSLSLYWGFMYTYKQSTFVTFLQGALLCFYWEPLAYIIYFYSVLLSSFNRETDDSKRGAR